MIGYDIQWASHERLLQRNSSVPPAEAMAFADEVIAEADPDAGLELREDFLRELRDSIEAVGNGTEVLISDEDVSRELGLG